MNTGNYIVKYGEQWDHGYEWYDTDIAFVEINKLNGDVILQGSVYVKIDDDNNIYRSISYPNYVVKFSAI
jgi:hypothetical protein